MGRHNIIRKEVDNKDRIKRALDVKVDKKVVEESRNSRVMNMERDETVFVTEYDSRMCDEVMLLMGEGLSREEVAVQLNITYGTLCRWEEENIGFRRALLDGHYRSMAWWVTQGRNNLSSYTGEKFNTTLYTFMMKNRFGFTDVQKVSDSKETIKEDEKEDKEYEDTERSKSGCSRGARNKQTAEIINILTGIGVGKVTDTEIK